VPPAPPAAPLPVLPPAPPPVEPELFTVEPPEPVAEPGAPMLDVPMLEDPMVDELEEAPMPDDEPMPVRVLLVPHAARIKAHAKGMVHFIMSISRKLRGWWCAA
jgi:hypothetical protein